MSTQHPGAGRPEPVPGTTAEQLAAHLTALPDRDVAALLAARPDLVSPPSSSFTALAARAGARPSVETALRDLDSVTVAVAEAAVALSSTDPVLLGHALWLSANDVAARLAVLTRLALVIQAGPVPGLVDAFGPYPFGLGPWAGGPLADDQLPPPLTDLEQQAQDDPSIAVLKALAWGPPVGTLGAGHRSDGASELVARGWLERSSDSAGRTRFILPREVGLALRGGRLVRTPLVAPGSDDLDVLAPEAIAAEATSHAEEVVRLTRELLTEWGREGGQILRTGGVGVRALDRTAAALGLERTAAATIIELAAAADLLGLDEAGAAWVPASTASAWLEAELPEQWAALAVGWAASARTPWLVGTRSDDGVLRPVLGTDVEAAWAGRLRRRILTLLASLPEGTAVDAPWVRDALTFARPRRQIPDGAVTAVLAEAELLGLTGGGALSRAGGVLASSSQVPAVGDTDAADAAPTDETAPPAETNGQVLAALEHALAADLPADVGILLVQSDLTAIVPGRPSRALAQALERSSVVESRGGALTVRFTPESVRRALDAGWSAEELVQRLSRFSPSPLPSALRVLIDDAARRHGAVRVREVASVLRVADAAVAAGIVADAALKHLGLDEVAPGVIVSAAPAGVVLRELRATGLAPVLEDGQGRLLVSESPGVGRRAPAPASARPGNEHAVSRRRPGRRELAALVGRLRAGEEARRTSDGGAAAATDPVHALALLRQARASRARVRLRLAGPDGTQQERTVRVLAVEPGRVRLADLVRETELTVAVHRIVTLEIL
ncbi:helicase-associated domain-containing protein [Actinomyces sp. 594]|uniref:helicase-associated domain-containing protein n=1 Tax=Actinomyces sp. 594 TaxID=2057793 RepID=UPI001C593CBD|nr:helicase-associated domain-containing protein [Actinomyces sp. 594]MBW3068537.1 helicase-associated domain-containing protein [Actinomyces sp. 594]